MPEENGALKHIRIALRSIYKMYLNCVMFQLNHARQIFEKFALKIYQISSQKHSQSQLVSDLLEPLEVKLLKKSALKIYQNSSQSHSQNQLNSLLKPLEVKFLEKSTLKTQISSEKHPYTVTNQFYVLPKPLTTFCRNSP